jgi:MFS transporter, SP family, arabinose:H+ symporter
MDSYDTTPAGQAMAKPAEADAEKIQYKYVVLISSVAAFGGLLFGYDTAVVSGAIGYLQTHFELNAEMKGLAASIALIGCMVGAGFVGMINDGFGRKKTLILCALLFAISSIGTAIPTTLMQFLCFRFMAGIAIGAVSVTSPMYIAEISPEQVRGRLVSLYQLAIVSGIFIVFFVNATIQRMGDEAWNERLGWRLMFGVGTVPSIVFGILSVIVPESPRWLVKRGRLQEATEILARVSGRASAVREVADIQASLTDDTGKISELFLGGYRRAFLIGIVLAILQQFCGINAIMYYAPEIFKSLGSETGSAFVQAVSVGAVNLLFTLVAVAWVDRIGRKSLLISGIAVQVVSLGIVGWLFQTKGNPWFLLAFILVYVAAFAAAMGPVVWIVISEIFPNKIRGRAVSIATLALWGACFAVSVTFPKLVESIGPGYTFWFYGFCSFLCLMFVWMVVPETKGRTLEEIEQDWLKR